MGCCLNYFLRRNKINDQNSAQKLKDQQKGDSKNISALPTCAQEQENFTHRNEIQNEQGIQENIVEKENNLFDQDDFNLLNMNKQNHPQLTELQQAEKEHQNESPQKSQQDGNNEKRRYILRELEEVSDRDEEEDNSPIKINEIPPYNVFQQKSQEVDKEKEEEEEQEDDESEDEDLFDVEDIKYEILDGKSLDKKQVLGINTYSGQSYVIKKFTPEEVQFNIFKKEFAIKVAKVVKLNNYFSKIQAINMTDEGGVDIIQTKEKGESLSLFLNTPYTEKEAKVWIIKILEALLILHENKIAHGNVKPNNIIVGEGSLKLTDINLFENIEYTESFYSAPEMITGSIPFLQKDPTLTLSKLKKKISAIRLRFEYNPTLNEFIQKMISHSPHQRKTAKEILNCSFLSEENSLNALATQKSNQVGTRKASKKFSHLSVNSMNSETHQNLKNTMSISMLQLRINPKQSKSGLINLESQISVFNIKEKELQQSESYVPISISNLRLTTQMTGGTPQQDEKNIMKKDVEGKRDSGNKHQILLNNSSLQIPQAAYSNHHSAFHKLAALNSLKSHNEYDEALHEEKEKYQNNQIKYLQMLKLENNEEEYEEDEQEQNYSEAELREINRKQNEIEKQLLDILNQQLDESNTSFTQNNSFTQNPENNTIANYSENFLEVNRNNRGKFIQQQSSMQEGNKICNFNMNEKQALDEMKRILDQNSSFISVESMAEFQKQISNNNFQGLRKLLSRSTSVMQYQNSHKISNQNSLNKKSSFNVKIIKQRSNQPTTAVPSSESELSEKLRSNNSLPSNSLQQINQDSNQNLICQINHFGDTKAENLKNNDFQMRTSIKQEKQQDKKQKESEEDQIVSITQLTSEIEQNTNSHEYLKLFQIPKKSLCTTFQEDQDRQTTLNSFSLQNQNTLLSTMKASSEEFNSPLYEGKTTQSDKNFICLKVNPPQDEESLSKKDNKSRRGNSKNNNDFKNHDENKIEQQNSIQKEPVLPILEHSYYIKKLFDKDNCIESQFSRPQSTRHLLDSNDKGSNNNNFNDYDNNNEESILPTKTSQNQTGNIIKVFDVDEYQF